MTNRLSKIITRKGDDGTTSVDGGKTRLLKSDPRISALGSLDELNCAIGIVIAYLPHPNEEIKKIKEVLEKIQDVLFDAGGELCPPYRFVISTQIVDGLTTLAKNWNKLLPPLKEFILPRGHLAIVHCHFARAICRRAEREIVYLNSIEKINSYLLIYLNRLSDLLFIVARILANQLKIHETCWSPLNK